jgi:hypothetical protein
MSLVLLAADLGDTIQRFGSYGGLAAIVGLGVLSLLYFSQAREVKRLREWAGRAPERAAELEQRVQADARRVVAQPLSPATTAAQKAEAARTAAAAALYAKVPPPPPPPPPLVGQPGQLARPTAVPNPAAQAAAATGATGTAATGSAPEGTTPAAAQADGATAAPQAATAAAQAAAAAPALDNGNGQETRESPAARPDPPVPALEDPVLVDVDDGGVSTARIAAIVGGAVAAVIVAVVVAIALTSGNETPKPNDFGSVTAPAAAGQPGGSSTTASASALDRRATRVAVLNGTTQTGLARAVADKIEQARFTLAGTGNNADQAVPTTTVSYRDGNESAAQTVAQIIGVDRTSVQAVDANTSAAADADVVVIVGADKIG